MPPEITMRDSAAPVAPTEKIDATKAPVEQAPAEPAKPSQDDLRFQQLARRERMLRSEAKRVEQEKAQLKQQLDEAQKWKAEKEALEQRLTQDPYGLLYEKGLTQQQLTDMLLNSPDLTTQEVRVLKQKIASLEAKQQETLQSIQQQQQSSTDQALKQITMEVKSLVKASEEFEAIRSMNAEHAVVELIKKTWDDEGYLMDVAEAAKEIEEVLVEEALKISQMKKLQAKQNIPANEEPVKNPQGSKPAVTTLTHQMAGQSKPLTDKDRKARAILAFQGKL